MGYANFKHAEYCIFFFSDRCRNKGIFGYKTETDPSNCCSYWKCDNGVSRADCCGKGMTFNPQTGQCEYDDQCQSPCLYQEIMPGKYQVVSLTFCLLSLNTGKNILKIFSNLQKKLQWNFNEISISVCCAYVIDAIYIS